MHEARASAETMIELADGPNRTTYGADWMPAFLAALATHGSVKRACEDAKVDKSTVYQVRKKYPEFATAWADARKEAADELVDEARRRALEGVERPIYQGGKLVGTERVYSDRLMEVLLKGLLPDVFVERRELTGPNGGPVALGVHALTDEQLERIASGADTDGDDAADGGSGAPAPPSSAPEP